MANPATILSELEDAEAVLAEAGERWLEVRATGKSTETIDAEVEAATRAVKRLNRKLHTARKRGNT